jgi:dihydropyrimidinase
VPRTSSTPISRPPATNSNRDSAIGSDADIALWDTRERVTLTNEILQHGADYTPYEGLEVRGWPVRLLVRGQTIMERGSVVEAGQGQHQSRKRSNLIADTSSGASARD